MEIARLYRDAQRSFVELASTLTDDDWRTPVPCSPGWTVHDVLSHVAGITADVLERNVEGAATEPWTAAQVRRWSETPRDELIVQWNAQVDPVAEALEAIGESRPPFDCHTHEHDVRHALGRPGRRESELVRTMFDVFRADWTGRPIEIVLDDGTTEVTSGAGPRLRLADVTRFEVARSRMGRRSRAQVAAWNWSEPPTDAELDAWFVFGPSPLDIDE